MATGTAAAQSALESTAAKAPQTSARKIAEAEDEFEQIDRIHDSIARRAFEIFRNNGNGLGHDVENWFEAESELLHPVHVEMTDDVGAVHVHAEVPGFEAKDLEIKLEPNRVTVSGKRETNEERKAGIIEYREHRANQILRVMDLPAVVDASKAQAILKNGVLEVRMPKGKRTKTTRIQVKAN